MEKLARIMTKQGISLLAVGDPEAVAEYMGIEATAKVITTTGAELFPPEVTWIRGDQILYVQSVSDEAWAWQKQMDTRHYASQLEDSPAERYADAVETVARYLKEQHGDES